MSDSPLRALIVDDEPAARAGIRRLVERDPDLVVVGECRNGVEAVAAIERQTPDIVLLDVEMPELDGLGVVQAIPPDRMPLILFITAYDHYAVSAFQVSAVDYIVKPFDDERFALAIKRLKNAARTARLDEAAGRILELLRGVNHLPAHVTGNVEPFLSRLVIKIDGRSRLVDVREIDWIEAANYYSKVHIKGRTELMRTTLTMLESRLDPQQFFRLHRSAIVNLDRVRELRPAFRGEHVVLLDDGTRLRLPRGRRDKLAALLGQPV